MVRTPTPCNVDVELQEEIDGDSSWADSPVAEVVAVIRALDPDNRTAKVSIRVNCLTRTEQQAFNLSGPKGDSIFVPGTESLKPEYADDMATLSLQVLGVNEIRIPIRLADIVDGTGFESTIDIQSNTDPAQFPDDQWVFDGFAALQLPPGVVNLRPVGWGNDMPMAIGFARDDRLSPWSLDAKHGLSRAHFPSNGHPYFIADVNATLSRPCGDWLFVYVIGFSPAIIGLAYHVSRRKADGDAAAVFSLAATLVSLLAIRQVVTPADRHGLTHLDRLLGVELIALIVAFTFVSTSTEKPRFGRARDLMAAPTRPKPRG
jgi:hypothetical protein